jgi:beta-aspartyl-peptidase (threonine type)
MGLRAIGAVPEERMAERGVLGRRSPWRIAAVAFTAAACLACAGDTDPAPPAPAEAAPDETVRREWAIAIHGGAGTPERDMPEVDRAGYVQSLEAALRAGADLLDAGGTSLDAVELAVRMLEDDPRFNAGHGAVFTADGGHELDASIMDGATLACGAVGSVRTVRNPVSLARLVMEKTRHVLLVGEGAEAFATRMGVERVENADLDTDERRRALERFLSEGTTFDREGGGTGGAVALDRNGNLAAATSTGGLTGKMAGRIGDTPIVGAGTFADNRTCAVSGTGVGEEFIRHGIARRIGTLMTYESLSLEEAARRTVHEVLRPGEGGIIAVGRDGTIAMEYNTAGMFRGAADSTGRFEARIWE